MRSPGPVRRAARVLLAALLVLHQPAMAAVIVVDGTCTLVDAITAANNDSATGSCPAGSGADEIQLTVDVTLTAVDNTTDGSNGLPSITSDVTIEGVGVSPPRAIARDLAAPDFRIFHVETSGTLGLESVAVSNGRAFGGAPQVPPRMGGGIFNRGQLALTNSTLSENSAELGGGGINNYGSVTLANSTLTDSLANSWGGGIRSLLGTVTLTNSTVSGNSSTGNYGGGGIYNYAYGTVTLNGSLVGHSPSGGNCGGAAPVTDGGSNLADDATCGTIPDTLSGLDPALAANGGPTMTHALLAGSNAIDLGGSCGLATDQRLFLRNDGSCDSGSFEFGALPAAIFADGFESGDTSAWSVTVP